MNAYSDSPTGTDAMPAVLRLLLLLEALGLLGVTIALSMMAGQAGADEVPLRFAAGGTIILAILALYAARWVQQRRSRGWTMAAIIQVFIGFGTAAAIFVAEWQAAFIAGFAVPTLVMLVLSTASVREALGQS